MSNYRDIIKAPIITERDISGFYKSAIGELFAFINLQNLPQFRRFSSVFGQKKRFFVQIQNSARKNVQGKSPVLEIRKREMNGGNRGYLPDWYS